MSMQARQRDEARWPLTPGGTIALLPRLHKRQVTPPSARSAQVGTHMSFALCELSPRAEKDPPRAVSWPFGQLVAKYSYPEPAFQTTGAKVGVVNKMEECSQKKKRSQVGVLWTFSFFIQGFEVAQETRSREDFLSEKCCYVDNRVSFLFMLEVLHWRSLGCSVNLGR